MPRFGFQNVLFSSTGDGTAKTATTAGTILPSPLYMLPANYFDYPGKKLRVLAWGRISCTAVTPGTVLLALRLNAISVFDSGALNLNLSGATNVPWLFTLDLVCRTVGAGTSATLFGRGELQTEALVGSPSNTSGGNGGLIVPVGAPVVGSGFNSSIEQAIDLFHTQTVGTGSIQVHHYVIEDPN